MRSSKKLRHTIRLNALARPAWIGHRPRAKLSRVVVVLLLLSPVCRAQGSEIETQARREIDAGNQAWVEGMKQGSVIPIVATYTDDAIDCDPTGKCIQGRAAIERQIKDQIEKLGRARSAFVTSVGSVQQGNFVYEWGQAEAVFANGNKVVERYLTAWQRQVDGSWKIFRNMVIPKK